MTRLRRIVKSEEGMPQTFTIPGRLAGLNEIVNQARYNRFAGASQKKKQTGLCLFWIKAARLRPVTQPVTVHFDWYEPNQKRDPDNIRTGAKFILDALVEAGTVPSDGQKWIKGLSDTFHASDAQKARIVTTVTEIGAGG